jgi:ribosomal protein S25
MANTIRALVFTILSLAFLASVADAQQATSGTGGGQKRHQQKTDKSAAQTAPKADEKAYNAALKRLPNKPYDPWSGAR